MLGGCQPEGRIYEPRSGLKGAASATQAGKDRLTARHSKNGSGIKNIPILRTAVSPEAPCRYFYTSVAYVPLLVPAI